LIKKKEGFLKFIVFHRFFMGSLEILLTFGALRFLGRDVRAVALQMVGYFSLNAENYYINYLLDRAGMIGNAAIITTSVVLFLSALLSFVEGYGLHKRRKWAEWCTVISTSSFIPFEVYGIARQASVITVAVLLLNIAIVYYLVRHRELFKRKDDIFLP